MTEQVIKDDADLQALLGSHPVLLGSAPERVNRFLSQRDHTFFLLIEGYGIPGEYDRTQVALLQQQQHTKLERCTITNNHVKSIAKTGGRNLSLSGLGRACETTINTLDRCGFFALPEVVGEEALDRSSAAIYAKRRDTSHLVHLYFTGRFGPLAPFRRIAWYWLTASAIRFQFRTFMGRIGLG